MDSKEQPIAGSGGPPVYTPAGQEQSVPMQQMSPQPTGMPPQQGMPPQVMYQMPPQMGSPQPQMAYAAGYGQPMGQAHPGAVPQQAGMHMSPPGMPIGQNGQPMQSPVQVMSPVGTMPTQYKTATPIPSLSASPAPVDCPSCGQRGLTSTAFTVGGTTHAWAAVICAFFCLGCIPYLVNGLKDVEHKCGRCGVHLATWHRSGRTDVHMHS